MKKRLLLVDDDSSMLGFVQLGLESEFWTIETASDAMSGFEKVRDIRPFLIISDFQMPDFGKGTDLVRAIRREPVIAKTPIIILTGMELQHVRARLPKGEELVRMLNKPPDFDLLRRYIAELTGVGDPFRGMT